MIAIYSLREFSIGAALKPYYQKLGYDNLYQQKFTIEWAIEQ